VQLLREYLLCYDGRLGFVAFFWVWFYKATFRIIVQIRLYKPPRNFPPARYGIWQLPTLQNRSAGVRRGVYIGRGIVVFGSNQIGDNPASSANCVVTKVVPANRVVIGVPARSSHATITQAILLEL
jgi:acetyltransferase-like isoleucine patch superfamily enzyme